MWINPIALKYQGVTGSVKRSVSVDQVEKKAQETSKEKTKQTRPVHLSDSPKVCRGRQRVGGRCSCVSTVDGQRLPPELPGKEASSGRVVTVRTEQWCERAWWPRHAFRAT